MAAADYRLCDVCGCKTFYDANLDYQEPTKEMQECVEQIIKEGKIKMIHCCGCNVKVEARLTDGSEIYPNRDDLHNLPFWKCDTCGNFVGCHHKTKNRTRPLGCIPTPEIKNVRRHIHMILDPLWQSGRATRKSLYNSLTKAFGRQYHTANIRSVEEAREVWKYIRTIELELPW